MFTIVKLGVKQPLPESARKVSGVAFSQKGKDLAVPETFPSKEEAKSWLKKVRASYPDSRYAVVPLRE